MSDTCITQRLFHPGGNCCAVARTARASVLVDGAAYFDAFVRAAQRAERSILIVAWDFNSQTPLTFDGSGAAALTLGDFLNSLARRRWRLHTRVLDWDYPIIFGRDREFSPLYGLNWKPHRRVRFEYDDTHPLAGSHHQKIVVIDDKVAFVGGLDLTCKRWDTPAHQPGDPRRIAAGKPYPPFHDLMMVLDGAAARELAGIARARWHAATGEAVAPVETGSDPWPDGLAPDFHNVEIGIACTAPPVNSTAGSHHVEQLYLDMIASARRYIYLENQYFTADKVGRALASRLAEPDGPEIVLVTRLLSHGWLEEMTMHVLRARLIRALRAADANKRFHVCYPHIEGLAEGTCIDMHSKAMIVDDEWLRVGSANISNRSMGLDTECDAVVAAGGAARASAAIRGIRDRLLAEHLGVEPAVVAGEIARTGSMRGAIESLNNDSRGLRPLNDLPDWSPLLVNAIAIADPERPVGLEKLAEEFTFDGAERPGLPLAKILGAVLAIFVGLALVWRHAALADLVSADNVAAWAAQLSRQWWAPLVIMLSYTPASLIMFPRPLITLAAVIAFGPWAGAACAIGGILIAAIASYGVGRLLDRHTVRRLAGPKLHRLTLAIKQRGLLAVTAVRMVPVAPFAVVGLAAGAIRINLWHFVLGTLFGTLPGVLAGAVFGVQIEVALDDPAGVNYWLIAGVCVLFAGAVYGVRRWFLRMERE